MRRAASAILSLALGMGATPALAQSEPLSAIDWLSDSVEAPPPVVSPEPAISRNALPGAVTITPLDRVLPDTVGLFDPQTRGLSAQIWAASAAGTLARQLANTAAPRLPVAQDLLHDLLLTRAIPPQNSAGGTAFFLSRLDALLALGAFGDARALMEASGYESPEIFRRWFDLTLLTGQENRACRRMRALPEITPTYPARIFCLARSGDWPAAALTLDTARTLGVITAAETERLTRFLDEFSSAAPLPPPADPTPLDYMLYEAMGEPIPIPGLPLPFAHGDLRRNSGWKLRVEAAERLARFGAIPADELWSIYGERGPAASGALWDRVGAAMALDRAMEDGDPDAISTALPTAWDSAAGAGLQAALAQRHAKTLSGMALTGRAAEIARDAALLVGTWPEVGALPPGPVAQIVAGEMPGGSTPIHGAIAAGLSGADLPAAATALLGDGRLGEALIHAVGLLEEARGGNLDALTDALAILVAADQPVRARQAAIELLILVPQR